MSDNPASTRLNSQDIEDYEHLAEMRVQHLRWVDQPLVLISQVPRSGGTLLMRLFDGHPECHTMPHELSIRWGRDGKLLEGPEEAWRDIADRNIPNYFEDDFRQARRDQSRTRRTYPLLLPPLLQRRIFEHCFERLDGPSERDVVNCYMTSYFNAWLDNQNLYAEEKRWITAFTPRLNTSRGLERFRTLYPDGRLISVLRDPKSWYASAREWSLEWHSVQGAIASWRRSAEAMLALKEELGDRLFVVAFEDLLTRTEPVMRGLAGWLEIRFESLLGEPTFNRQPIKANSSFEVTSKNVQTEPLLRYRQLLSAREQEAIDAALGGLYKQVLDIKGEPVGESRAERKARKRRQRQDAAQAGS
jgi:hypothetical protein